MYGHVTEPILLKQGINAHNRTLLCIKATVASYIPLTVGKVKNAEAN